MKKIKSANSVISTILGDGVKKDGVKYRMTKHCHFVACDDGRLILHTLTDAMFLLEKEETAEDHEDEFIKEHFFVPESFDEEKLSRDMMSLAKQFNKKEAATQSFTVLTTTDCNARCYYCYEMGRRRLHMSEQIAHDTASYIARKSKGKEVSLCWFGGEPLYNRRAIEIITEDLRQNGIEFHSRMISNGYYLDESTCKTAREKWNLKKVQITLDGTKDVYQKSKAYIERDPNAFDRVLNNMDHALENGIHVAVRLNIDCSNAENMKELVDLLGRRFGKREKFYVYPAPLKQIAGKVHVFEDEMQKLEAYEALVNRIDSWNIGRVHPLSDGLLANVCMADSESSEVLLPDGRIGKCEHHSEENLVGSIYSDEYDDAMLRAWKEIMPKYPECSGCPLYPRCKRLVKCDYTEQNCSAAERIRKEHALERQMLAEYDKYIKNERR